VQLAVVEVHAGFSEIVEVQKDLFDAGYVGLGAGDVDAVRAKIDVYVKLVLEEVEILIVSPIEGFDAGGDFEGFFDQVVC
jgi:hypothetical protein